MTVNIDEYHEWAHKPNVVNAMYCPEGYMSGEPWNPLCTTFVKCALRASKFIVLGNGKIATVTSYSDGYSWSKEELCPITRIRAAVDRLGK